MRLRTGSALPIFREQLRRHQQRRRRRLRFEMLESRRVLAGLGTIQGVKYNDLNGDGNRDDGEPGLQGWTIYLDQDGDGFKDAAERSTTTGQNGEYLFTALDAGTYVVAEVEQTGWTPTSPKSTALGSELISVTIAGEQANARSDNPAVSADGRYVVFESDATNIAAGSDGQSIILRDRLNNTVERIDVGLGGAVADGPSSTPSVSADGRYVAFVSSASNLVSGDANGVADVFVFDRQLQQMERVSVSSSGTEGNGAAQPRISVSSDGRYVVFASSASNLVSGDTNGRIDVFVHDRQTHVTFKTTTTHTTDSLNPVISSNGRYIVYESGGAVYRWDRQLGTIISASDPPGIAVANGDSHEPVVSADGRYVAFWSNASNLVAGDSNDVADVILYDAQLATWERVSLATNGAQANNDSAGRISMSADGRYVTFVSTASNLVPGDSNHLADAFIRDRIAGTTRLGSISFRGELLDKEPVAVVLSSDGSALFISTDATNAIANDINQSRDIVAIDVRGMWRTAAHVVHLDVVGAAVNRDFGNWQATGSIQGLNWHDRDRDAVIDSYEQRLADWRIYIDTNNNGSFDDGEPTQLTDANGSYQFTDLTPGTYIVGETLPNDWEQFYPGGTGQQSVPVGVPVQYTFDFEDLAHTGSSSSVAEYRQDGFVFSTASSSSLEWNVYGPQNSTYYTGSAALKSLQSPNTLLLTREDGLPFSMNSIALTKKGTTNSSTVTFYGIRERGLPFTTSFTLTTTLTNYNLSFMRDIVALEWRYSDATSFHQFDNVVLNFTSLDHTDVSFGNIIKPGDIHGNIWQDIDRDGEKDPSEPPLASKTVYLDLDQNGVFDASDATTQSNENGDYAFLDLEPGTYTVLQTFEDGWEQTYPATGHYTVELDPGEVVSGLDFGNRPHGAEIHGTKWNDNDGDGVFDANEPPLAGWTMYLDMNTNGQLDADEPSTLTDEQGGYSFTELTAGNYAIAEVSPERWLQTFPGPVSGTNLLGFTYEASTCQSAILNDNGRFALLTKYDELFLFDVQKGTSKLVANGYQPSISGDARYVAFANPYALTENDQNYFHDIYVYDQMTDTTYLASISSDGMSGNGQSWRPQLSADGRFVVFISEADNLVPDDTNDAIDVFVHDLVTHTTSRLSLASDGSQLDGDSYAHVISRDGLFAAFASVVATSEWGDVIDYFVVDRSTGQVERIKAATTEFNGAAIDISDDGRWVVFQSDANLSPVDTDFLELDVYLYDRTTTNLELITTGYTGSDSFGWSPSLDATGRFIMFRSWASNLVRGDTNLEEDVFVVDRHRDTTQRINVELNGSEPEDKAALQASISADGRYVSYSSRTYRSPGVYDADCYRQANPLALLPNTYWLQLHTGEIANNVNVGNWQTVELHGTSWDDLNNDGQKDPDERGMKGVTVFLDANQNGALDADELSTRTDDIGNYSFIDLTQGTYTIAQLLEENWERTYPASGSHVIQTQQGDILHGLNFGNGLLPGEIHGQKWQDNDGNGAPGPDEPPLAGWTIYLDLNANGQLDAGERSTITDEFGNYSFTDVHAGNYIVAEVPADGWQQSFPGPVSGGPVSTGTDSKETAISDDGRFVALQVGYAEIYLYDLQTQTYEWISVSADGQFSGGYSPSISGDAQKIAFQSFSLDPDHANNYSDIYVRDRAASTITNVSRPFDGSQTSGGSQFAEISADGRYVVFMSFADNVVPGDTNGVADIFVHDLQTQTTTRLLASDGLESNNHSWSPVISRDGRFVAFQSAASNLVAGDDNNLLDIFVLDRNTGQLDRIEGRSTWFVSEVPVVDISDDGRWVTFFSEASLLPSDTDAEKDIYFYDRSTSALELITDGYREDDGASYSPRMDGSGRFITFLSTAHVLVRGDTNGVVDAFVFDRVRQTIQRVNVNLDGSESLNEATSWTAPFSWF